VPALDIVEARITAISEDLSVDDIAYDFDAGSYRFRLLARNGRQANLDLSRELLEDLRDNPSGPKAKYTLEISSKLTAKILEAIESSGLIAFGDEALKYLLLRVVVSEHKNGRTVHKYNAIGKDVAGQFEQWLKADLLPEEKDALIWSWGELMRLRLIAPRGNDLVAPDEWAKATERGIAAVEGKSFTEYEEMEVFISKGEVYTAYRALQRIFQQARSKVIIIDPYMDEQVLDHVAELDANVDVQLITENIKSSFKIAYTKLVQQRGNVEARTVSFFHDRFIVLDDLACYQLGSSINHLGNKATVVDRKGEVVRDRILADAARIWPGAKSL
jgi:hypothetical protein